ncbi:DUF6985 domain-containing protein [Hymenobacter jeollabukensis]|uniref:DUF6985 domain-containing protein n=1 Tax=Hymenobacter jeollabukensis TaxID=2025313 RepID=A0A5R8WK58_9BACT|nr:hypothetical protein [Hymenobacter jeollabukensis]TLM89411.1 hypothetical protein FDY95_20270 [Hymenobacter jeollabukensis]
MTQAEILKHCQWDDLDFATLAVDSALLGQSVTVRFMPAFDSGRVITEQMVAVLNDFLALTPAELPRVKQLLWDDCQSDFDNIDYGVQPGEGEIYQQVNRREFGIYNAEDAYAKSNLQHLSIPEEELGLRHRYGAIDFEPEWAGHGCSIIMQDGRLIAAYSNDWHFSQYESAQE